MRSTLRSIRADRLAVMAMFFINGAILASWVSRIPLFQARFELSDGALGLVLLGNALGVLTALFISSGLIQRFGSRSVTLAGGVLGIVCLPALALMPHPVLFSLDLFLFGLAHGTMDIAMNGQGAQVEQRAGKPMMSSFHATWSIGGVIGAAVGALMSALNILPLLHFMMVALLFAILLLRALPALIPDRPQASSEPHSVFQLPPRVLWPLGFVVCIATFGEAAVANWSTVYLSNVIHTEESIAALGYTVFMLAMTIGRVLGDWLSVRYSAYALVRSGGLLAALGLALAVVQPQVAMALLGFAAVGAGLSIMVPLSFSVAGKMPGFPPGIAIAGVATIGYAGFLSAPSITGWLAEFTSLPLALLIVAALMGLLVFLAQSLRIPNAASVPAGD